MTAAERAAEVLFQATKAAMRGVEGYDSWLAIGQAQVAALMADPDLLVDLAIDAGGLRAVKPRTVYIGSATERFEVDADPGTVQVFYRRTPEVDR